MTAEPAQLVALEHAADALDLAAIPYALIGGLAVGVLTGVPRATMDVDLAVPSVAPRADLVAAMRSAGFVATGSFPHSLNFRHGSGEPVQFAIDPEFDPMIARAGSVTVGARTIRVVQRADLVTMKRRAAADPARPRSKSFRDQADIELLLGDVSDPDEGW